MPDPTPQTVAEATALLRSHGCCMEDYGALGVDELIETGRVEYARLLSNLIAAVQRETLAAVREKVESERLTDETDHPMDRGYNCAIKDALAQIDLYLATLAEPPR